MKGYKLATIAFAFIFIIFIAGCAQIPQGSREVTNQQRPATSIYQQQSEDNLQAAQADKLMEAELDKVLEEQTDDLKLLEASILA